MRNLNLILIWVATALLHAPVAADTLRYRVSEMPTQRQMPVANVHCLMQDSEGFMWYGTTGGGLCRDDGYRIDVFRTDGTKAPSLPGNDITCLAEDASGGIWVGTTQGACRIDKRDYRVRPMLRKELRGQPVSNILCDSRHRIWVSGNQRIVCLDSARHVCGVHELKDVRAESLYEDEHGDIWVGLWTKGLRRYDARTARFVPCPWQTDGREIHIMGITRGQSGALWISTWGDGIVHYDVKSGRVTQQQATLGGENKQRVLDCLRDSRQGLFWVTTMDDLYLYRERDGRLESAGPSPLAGEGGKILDRMTEDKDGNIWVAGFSPRTRIISPDNDRPVRHEVPDMLRLTGYHLLADRVVADGNRFWIWQGRWGLTLFNPGDGSVKDAGGWNYSRSLVKCEDRPGIWALSENAVVRLTADGPQESIPTDSLHPTALVEHDGVLWIGTDRALLRYSVMGGKLEHVCDTRGPVGDIVANPNGEPYFIVADSGVFDRHGLVLAGTGFTALAMAADGTPWVASEYGKVYRMDGTQAVEDTLAGDERGDAVKDMLFDAAGHLWVMSDLKVKEINPRLHSMRIIHADDPSVRVGYFYTLSHFDGQHVILAGDGAFCIMKSAAELDRSRSQARSPRVTAVMSADTLRLMGSGEQRVQVPPTNGGLSLRLSTLEHLDAASILFAYRIDESDWIYLPQGSNIVQLNHLSKGEHKLTVKCTDSGGCWGDPTEVMTICRLPFWWETWWARLFFILFAVILLLGLRTLRRRILMLRELQKKRKEIVLTEIELNPDELRASKIDGQFLQKAVEAVEKNISNGRYNVACFSSDMCMSRMSLYRRLQHLTGLSPMEFVRDIRLKKAAQIIKANPEAPINEVAAKVGFTTPSYFSKCFRRMFGMLPTQYGHCSTAEEGA